MKLATRYSWSLYLGRILRKIKRKFLKAAPRFELGIKDLQSSALPLGHAAEYLEHNFTNLDSISPEAKYLLVLSNGHGEDLIALRILEALHKAKPQLKLEVLPLVGDGKVYEDALNQKWLIKKGPSLRLPSGGFSNQSFRGLIADLSAGLLLALFSQWRYARKAAREGRTILAVGDLLPLFFAWSSGSFFGFIGTPKSDYTWTHSLGLSWSDYYHRFKGTEWDPWEYFLMKRDRCRFVCVRDHLTARGLKRKGVKALSAGNPMMDGFVRSNLPDDLHASTRLLLLCGSRSPEALDNFFRLILAAMQITIDSSLAILVVTGAEPSLNNLHGILSELKFKELSIDDYQLGAQSCWQRDHIKVFFGPYKFSEWATLTQVGLANAGTATEQLVGLGIPCVSLPGRGPQFKSQFALRQSRLLGGAVIPCETSKLLAKQVELLLDDDFLYQTLSSIGVKRMGPSGGSNRLAKLILKNLVDAE